MHPSKIIITTAFEHANVLEIQDISCEKTDKFPPFWLLECPKKGFKVAGFYWIIDCIEFLMKSYLYELLWVIINAIGNFWPFWTPIWRPGCPKKAQNLSFVLNEWHSIKFLVRNYFSVQTCSFWRLLLEKWPILDPFWPLGCPKKKKNLIWLSLNQS